MYTSLRMTDHSIYGVPILRKQIVCSMELPEVHIVSLSQDEMPMAIGKNTMRQSVYQ